MDLLNEQAVQRRKILAWLVLFNHPKKYLIPYKNLRSVGDIGKVSQALSRDILAKTSGAESESEFAIEIFDNLVRDQCDMAIGIRLKCPGLAEAAAHLAIVVIAF